MKVLPLHLTFVPAIISIVGLIWYLRRRKKDAGDKDVPDESVVKENEALFKYQAEDEKFTLSATCDHEDANILLGTEPKQSGNKSFMSTVPIVHPVNNFSIDQLREENKSFLDKLIEDKVINEECQSEVKCSPENNIFLPEQHSFSEPQISNIGIIKSDESSEEKTERTENTVKITKNKINANKKNNIDNEYKNFDNLNIKYDKNSNINTDNDNIASELKALEMKEPFILSTTEGISISEDNIKGRKDCADKKIIEDISDNNTKSSGGFAELCNKKLESVGNYDKNEDDNLIDINLNSNKIVFDNGKLQSEIKDETSKKLQNEEKILEKKVNFKEFSKENKTNNYIENEPKTIKCKEDVKENDIGNIEQITEDSNIEVPLEHKNQTQPMDFKEVEHVNNNPTEHSNKILTQPMDNKVEYALNKPVQHSNRDNVEDIDNLIQCKFEEKIESSNTPVQCDNNEEFKNNALVPSFNDGEKREVGEGDVLCVNKDEAKEFGDGDNQLASITDEKGFKDDVQIEYKDDEEKDENTLDGIKIHEETKTNPDNDAMYDEVTKDISHAEVIDLQSSSSVEIVAEDPSASEVIVVSSEDENKPSWCEMYDEEMDGKKRKKKIKKKKTIKKKNDLSPLTDVITKVLSNNDKNQSKISTHLISNNPAAYTTDNQKQESNDNDNNNNINNDNNNNSSFDMLRAEQKEEFSGRTPNMKYDVNDNVVQGDSGLESTTSQLSPHQIISDEDSCYRFSFPMELCGILIGRHGRNIKQLCQESGAEITVDFKENNVYNATHQIVTIFGSRVSIEAALKLMRKRFPPSRFPTIDFNPIPPPPPPGLNLPPPGQYARVSVSVVKEANHLFVHLPHHPFFIHPSNISAQLSLRYSRLISIPHVAQSLLLKHPIRCDDLCVSYVDGSFFRARVMDVSDSTCTVFHIDYGHVVDVDTSCLYQINSELVNPPFQAVECYLHGVGPLTESGFTEEACKYMESLLSEGLMNGCSFEATVVSYDAYSGIPLVRMYRGYPERYEDLGALLISAGHAEAVSYQPF